MRKRRFFMDRVEILDGHLQGLTGDALFFPNSREYSVSFPNRQNPQHKEIFPPERLKIIGRKSPPILAKKEFTTLQPQKDQVQITGCKVSCSSVWCLECLKRKGASKRIAKRLAMLDWQSTRQVILTVDLKKFHNSGQAAYESLKESEAVSQFIHNLKRTAHLKIKDCVWILEWHTDGAPHWHLFLETQKGKNGQIGNANLLKHWKHGLVFERYIKSENHWNKFTQYFGVNGYFDPKTRCESKNKNHQLTLPEWAMNVTYRIRKTGSMTGKNNPAAEEIKNGCDEERTESNKPDAPPKTYKQILGSCGQSTLCQIWRGSNHQIWKKIPIPYQEFKKFPGEYVPHTGYVTQMKLNEFFLFDALYDNNIQPLNIAN